METIGFLFELESDELVNICRTCLSVLTTEKTSIFNEIDVPSMDSLSMQENVETHMKIRIVDVILLCTSDVSVTILLTCYQKKKNNIHPQRFSRKTHLNIHLREKICCCLVFILAKLFAKLI